MAKLYLRVIASLIDMFFLLMIIMIGGFCVAETLNVPDSLYQILPFIIIECVVCPLGWLVSNISTTYIPTYIVIFLVVFLVETLYYFITDILPQKATLGKKILGIRICSTQSVHKSKIIRRSIAKTISRQLLLPLLICLFNERKQTLHDITAKTVVIEAGLSKEDMAKLGI